MHYKNFGESDLKTSAVGFGGWPMGRGHYGSFDENQVIRAIHRSIELGVTLFDTAAVYGWGEGEKLLGRAIADRCETTSSWSARAVCAGTKLAAPASATAPATR